MSDKLLGVLRLIKRSTHVDGWYKVPSSIFQTIIERILPDDLYEHEERNGEHFIRMTNEGLTLLKYV